MQPINPIILFSVVLIDDKLIMLCFDEFVAHRLREVKIAYL